MRPAARPAGFGRRGRAPQAQVRVSFSVPGAQGRRIRLKLAVPLKKHILCKWPRPLQVPGTAARSARSARARPWSTALLGLLDEGELSPTAERVAERARVSERSIFQHFGDREALFEAARCASTSGSCPTLRPIDPRLPLDERLDAFVAQRARLLERVTGVRRAALLREHESETIAAWLNAARRAKAREVERVFARELAELPDVLARDRQGGDGGRLVLAGLGELPHPPAPGSRAATRGDADPLACLIGAG